MSTAPLEQKVSKRGEVIIAIIGMVGVVLTGVFSNWDKLFPPQNVVQATYSGYRPTGNFETEFRYFFDVSGSRQALEHMQKQVLLNSKNAALSQDPGSAKEIERAFEVIEKESIKLDDVMREVLPIYQKHFTLAELQELNKFYSTEVMQGMTKKLPLVTQDAAPVQVRMMNDYLERVFARLQEATKK
jgi:Uncharacterized protein conserved in bacteria (DUF2059)